jgi:predicted nucleic acid-binding protein
MPRTWTSRANLTAYDAAYLALADGLAATLLTRDERLAAVPGARASVELI